jgi:23S rRNA (cytosine1962-C5)-methyltransferase
MLILKTSGFDDYELLDSGNGQRLERFGKYVLQRPDPQAIWNKLLPSSVWSSADAVYEKLGNNKGHWINKNNIPERWLMKYKELSFYAELTPFKHTGVFPEQSLQWDFIQEKISKASRPVKVLNLFAYTGIASLAAASAGASVTHLDASRPMIGYAKDNQTASNLSDKPIRWILDDALKFTGREIKRENKYDAIIMDPPIYGHGPGGERWDFNEHFPLLLKNCRQILTDNPLFIVVNAYAISSSALMLENVLNDYLKELSGTIEVGELALEEKANKRVLSTGIFARWFRS